MKDKPSAAPRNTRDWTLIERLGRGGNGSVWLVERNGQRAAMKVLDRTGQRAETRFLREIAFLSDNLGTKGIPRLIDSASPPAGVQDKPWYVMPVYTPVRTHLHTANPETIVRAFADLAGSLSGIHALGACHRDIKPDNIMWGADGYLFVDFGLVRQRGGARMTRTTERVGAFHTMAPEARRADHEADPRYSDTYSLAKSLWMCLTRREYAFEGQFDPWVEEYALWRTFPALHVTGLHDLLRDCTHPVPTSRPSIAEVERRLLAWCEGQPPRHFAQANMDDWNFLVRTLFPRTVPETVGWSNLEQIVEILNLIGWIGSGNHTLLPSGGGLDVLSARRSREQGCIDLFMGQRAGIPVDDESDSMLYRLRPAGLEFTAPLGDIGSAYFELTASDLELTGIPGSRPGARVPGVSFLREVVWERDDGRFLALPGPYENAPADGRPVWRFSGGVFLTVARASAYNRWQDAYDAPHMRWGKAGLRTFMERIVSELRRRSPEPR